MTWETTADVISAVLLLTGSFLVLAAGVGILRFPDLLARLHAATKPQVLGLMLVLAGAAFQVRDVTNVWIFVLIIIFQLLTAPVAAHMLSQASVRTGKTDLRTLSVNEMSDD